MLLKKEIEHLLAGGIVSGLTDGAVTVFIDSFIRYQTGGCFLFLTADETFNKYQYRYSRFFNNNLLYYPEPPNVGSVPGFQSNNNLLRSRALIGLASGGRGICISTESASTRQDINKKKKIKQLQVVRGNKIDRDLFVSEVLEFGYVVVDRAYAPGDLSIRGDIVDVFPENKKQPIRVSFNFSAVESLAFFDVDTQRKKVDIQSFRLYDLVGEPIESGRSLIDFVSWDTIINIKRKNEIFSLQTKEGGKTVCVACEPINENIATEKGFLGFIKRHIRERVFVFYTDKKRADFLKKLGARPLVGYINKPFRVKKTNSLFLSDLKKTRKKTSYFYEHNSLFLIDLNKISIGDLVVHVLHGLGVFVGLVTRGPSGFEKEYLKIKYSGGGLLFVPIDKLGLVHRYLGFGKKPKINTLGRGSWGASVSKTKKDIETVSQSLIDIYNSRKKPRGFSYEKTNGFMSALKRSFPYVETKDQKRTIEEVLGDLNKKQPMDRLVCGDVGFGKTEVALRAVVRVAASSRQTAFLCPTTVLSDQHYITAKERLGPLGIRVSLLSRFQSKKTQKETLINVLKRKVDLLIGTHRLLSDDVVLPSLGLLIIDEEHKFGVRHKESVRALRVGIDVLSLSATPIPRTLQQSMLGIRDISRIETPPITRKPIKTLVEFFSWERSCDIIKEELIRSGQVYFMHNNIQSIDYYTDRLRGFFPKETVESIHGQQDSRVLEKNLLSFFKGKISVLVCSTIIESGLDVSNANCIIINNPQNLGLSQLYQIRGRVGRGSRQAFCYLFIPKKTQLTQKAFRRLKTIERHTSLGSGYKIATSDLNLRGAGSVLGYKQSGQASRVGLEYYNDLLKEAINKKLYEVDKKNIVDVVFFGKALITKRYVSSEIERLSFYTRINKANKEEELKELREELLDRFGKLPAETNSFIDLAVIKLFYKKTLIRSITINKDSVVFEVGGKKTPENIINKILAYRNTFVLNKKFKEVRSGFFVVFNVVVGFSWFVLLLNSRDVFSDS